MFENNFALIGGAIYNKNIENLRIENTEFRGNIAASCEGYDEQYFGGAIYYYCEGSNIFH